VIGPKTPKLPHRAAKLEPISSSPRKAPSAAAGSAAPGLHEIRVAAKGHRLGQAELGPESETEHPSASARSVSSSGRTAIFTR